MEAFVTVNIWLSAANPTSEMYCLMVTMRINNERLMYMNAPVYTSCECVGALPAIIMPL